MTVELQILALAGLLWAGQLLGLSVAANLQLDSRWLMGPRDEPRRVEGLAGRLQRALSNMTESLLLFAVAVVVLEFGGKAGGPLSQGCAVAYLIARGHLVCRVRRDPDDALRRTARLKSRSRS